MQTLYLLNEQEKQEHDWYKRGDLALQKLIEIMTEIKLRPAQLTSLAEDLSTLQSTDDYDGIEEIVNKLHKKLGL